MAILLTNTQGQYYESQQPYVDPDNFNEKGKKQDYEQRTNADIERSSFSWNETWKQFANYQLAETNDIHTKSQSFIELHKQLMQQCEVLRDIIDGTIIGDRNYIAQEQHHNYIEELTQIMADLVAIEMSQDFKIASHLQLNNLQNNSNLNQEISENISKIETKQVAEKQIINIEVDEGKLNMKNKFQIENLEKRLQRLEKYVGLAQLTQVGKGKDLILSYKGTQILNQQNVLGRRDIQFKPNDIFQSSFTTVLPAPQVMPILEHIKLIKTTIHIMNGSEETTQQLSTMIESSSQNDKNEGGVDKIQQAIVSNLNIQLKNFGQQNEFTLQASDEIPFLSNRLLSLKQLHNDCMQLPRDIDQTQKSLTFMELQLREAGECLDILEQQLNENVDNIKQNIHTLREVK